MFYKAMLKREEDRKKNKRAFTLIELIIVIAIIGILIAILVPSMLGFLNEAKRTTALANARTMYSTSAAAVTFEMTTSTAATVTIAGAANKTYELFTGKKLTDAGTATAELEKLGYKITWAPNNSDSVTGVAKVTYTDPKDTSVTAEYPQP